MDLRLFYERWAALLQPERREEFGAELAVLITQEQARERRRLCTDQTLYRAACEETAAEIRRQADRRCVA